MFSIIKKEVIGNPLNVLDIINKPEPNPLELFYPKYHRNDYPLSNLEA